MPRPSSPLLLSQVNCEGVPAAPKRTVEEAVRPPEKAIRVEVALAATPKCVGTGVKGQAEVS